MSEPQPEPGNAPRSAKTNRFWIGVNLGILLILGAINIFTSVVIIPKFERIFADVCTPGLTLPSTTQFVITFRIPLTILAMCWPLLGIFVTQRQKIATYLRLNIALITSLLQIVFTIWALFNALWIASGTITGTPDSNHP